MPTSSATADAQVDLTVNGVERRVEGGDRLLLDVLRDDLGLRAAKYGCGLAQCGACTVLIDGAPARACVLRLRHVRGGAVETVEGLVDGDLHPVQAAFLAREGAQCGYCTAGMLMSAVALLRHEPGADEARVREALRHNLCRCGTHSEIVASVMLAAERMRDG
jgi:nicotinate dehydrogenase subunit A